MRKTERNRTDAAGGLALDLQMFAEYNTNTTQSQGLADENKTYYHDTLVDNVEPYLVHDQFAEEINIPEHGGRTVEVRCFDVLDKNTAALTEGVTPDGSSLSMSTRTATVYQYGDYVAISDVVSVTAIDPILVQATRAMGSQAGRSLDTVTRDVLTAGTNVMYAPRISGGTVTPVQSRADLDSGCRLTVDLILKAAAMLESKLAEPINGSYVCIIHPYAAYDLMRCEEFIDWHKYASPGELYKGEIGMIGNVRFVKSTEAKIVREGAKIDPDGADTAANRNAVYLTMVLGKGAYATTFANGLGLEHIVKPLGAGDDPLNQRATVGWKAAKTALRLKEQNMVRIESSCSFNTVDAN